jgi:ABC-type sugar transport system ATPase subunit
MPVGELSGGNQQKVALAKCMETHPRVLLLDEPTRGVDIGAKREIYALMEKWKAEGMAIVLITSELPELLLLADRILVMHRGRISAELDRSNATGERVIQAAMNH